VSWKRAPSKKNQLSSHNRKKREGRIEIVTDKVNLIQVVVVFLPQATRTCESQFISAWEMSVSGFYPTTLRILLAEGIVSPRLLV
jgi:hypothetical protein